jgi:hypothetical protein
MLAMRKLLISAAVSVIVVGLSTGTASAASSALNGCRLLVATQDSSLTKADQKALGGASLYQLIQVSTHDGTVKKIFATKRPLPALIAWCRGRYTRTNLHRVSTADLLAATHSESPQPSSP